MNYLGSNRLITNPFSSHIEAEDYAGNHKSPISIYGKGKVVKVIDRFKSHEDSINYNSFIASKHEWKDGNYYNCISITGKTVKMNYEELGGNQVYIETYDNDSLRLFRIAHLDSVNVKVGDIVDENIIIGYQGNTGLVLSSKSVDDETYGSHVHLEITDENGKYINPREYAIGNIRTTYIEQTNIFDKTKYQFKVNVDLINIREKPTKESKDLGNVYLNEVYDILEEVDSDLYTWYKITTNRGTTGYVANLKGENWLSIYKPDEDIDKGLNEEHSSTTENKDNILFECTEDGYYYIYLYKGEKLVLKV